MGEYRIPPYFAFGFWRSKIVLPRFRKGFAKVLQDSFHCDVFSEATKTYVALAAGPNWDFVLLAFAARASNLFAFF